MFGQGIVDWLLCKQSASIHQVQVILLALEAIDHVMPARPFGTVVHHDPRAPDANGSLRHGDIAGEDRGLVSVAYRKAVSVNGHRHPWVLIKESALVLRPGELGKKPKGCR